MTKTNGTFDTYNASSRIHANSLISPINSTLVEELVLNNVGSNTYVDPVDNRNINDYRNSTGKLISNESEVGGFPTLETGTAYTDTDNDGMDDAWELNNGLNPDNSNDGKEESIVNYYTNLEVFLNYLTIK